MLPCNHPLQLDSEKQKTPISQDTIATRLKRFCLADKVHTHFAVCSGLAATRRMSAPPARVGQSQLMLIYPGVLATCKRKCQSVAYL